MPSQKEIEPQLLLALHFLGGSAARPKVHEKVAEIMEISDEILEKKYKSNGFSIFKNKTDFARQNLKQKELLEKNSPRGTWELSNLGKKVVEKLLKNEDVSEFFKSTENEKNEDENIPPPSTEILEESEKSERELKILQEINWRQFEQLCVKIFEVSGFENVKLTRNGADGGIDGFGDLVFGLVKFRVAFQAKRWKRGSKIGLTEIQSFFGATQNRAEKFVFITTSSFTRDAKKEADRLGIELIDGEKVLEILKENEIGFRKKMISDFSIDENFFKNL
ncbi:MAG: restriction endonuclease [Patescibacteria group bacterium]